MATEGEGTVHLNCVKCEEPITERWNFCPICGTTIPLVCAGCHQPVKTTWKFCCSCGQKNCRYREGPDLGSQVWMLEGSTRRFPHKIAASNDIAHRKSFFLPFCFWARVIKKKKKKTGFPKNKKCFFRHIHRHPFLKKKKIAATELRKQVKKLSAVFLVSGPNRTKKQILNQN